MFFLVLTSLAITSFYSLKYIFRMYNNLYISDKTFENHNTNEEDDEYILICYLINLKDGTEKKYPEELSLEEIENLDENIGINFIEIHYLFNGIFMKYITRELDLTFPIYSFNVSKTYHKYYPEKIFINGLDVTDYIMPYAGPLCNFYNDRSEPIKIEDCLRNHPEISDIDLNNGYLEFVSNSIEGIGRKLIKKELPCRLIWKRHAAVDPIEERKMEIARNN